MKMFRLYIGTTDGPTEIQRVTPEDPEVRSVVCLDGKAIALPISDDYDAFVRRPTGVVEALTGHAAYRVDISHPISGGYSWQLGIAVAHLLAGRRCLAGPEDKAGEALWLTGEVDHNLNIGAVDDVGLKLTRAMSMLKSLIAEGLRVTVVVPGPSAAEARGTLAAAFADGDKAPRLVAADHLDDVLAAMGAPRRAKNLEVRGFALRSGRRALGGLALAATVFAVVLATAAAWPLGGETGSSPAPPASTDGPATNAEPLAAAPTGAPPAIALIEFRAPAGSDCAAVNFNHAKPVIARHLIAPSPKAPSPKEGAARQAREVNPAGLCDLRHRIVNPGLAALTIAAIAARHDRSGGRFRTRSLIPGRTLDAGATLEFDARPPRDIAQPLVQRLVVLALPSTWPRARMRLGRAMASLGAATSKESWSRAIATMARGAIFIARSREIFRPPRVAARKTRQTLP
ncbi:MAG: hypothetical protein O6831_01595 [Alphaproteobacteria bacterium]|nr:hypothetical protein [Alphaproteobacteria bacterium]